MRLDDSRHCSAVRFTLKSPHPYPFNLCYCSICPNTSGGGPVPVPSERTHNSLDSTASWLEVRADPQDKLFQGFADESIADWHERLGLVDGNQGCAGRRRTSPCG